MNKNFYGFGATALFLLSACSYSGTKTEVIEAPQEESQITLQNLKTRVLIRCYNSAEVSAEKCAQLFEEKGFVRLKNIPSQTADYDLLKTNTYPTRRWREGEKNPRW